MEQGVVYPERLGSLDNRIAREQTRSPPMAQNRPSTVGQEIVSTSTSSSVSSTENDHAELQGKANDSQRSGSRERSENENGPGRTIGGKSGPYRWPLLRKKSLRKLNRRASDRVRGAEEVAPATSVTVQTPSQMSTRICLKVEKPELLTSTKRKASVPDMVFGRMTTVQEGLLDSRKSSAPCEIAGGKAEWLITRSHPASPSPVFREVVNLSGV